MDALGVAFSWETQQSVRISPAPVNGSSVIIYRKTDISKPSVEFTNASVVSATAHNHAYRNNLHVVQEAYDALDGVAERAQASAQRAEDEATDAENARDAAVVAQGGAETARTSIENVKTEVEGIRDTINTTGSKLLTDITTLGNTKTGEITSTAATEKADIVSVGDSKVAEVVAAGAGMQDIVDSVNIPSGLLAYFAMAAIPAGWLYCDGSAVSRTVYASLFANIGTTFGAGDGSSTFNLPDLRYRTITGSGTGRALGSFEENAAPNITGTSNGQTSDYGRKTPDAISGAFYNGDAYLVNNDSWAQSNSDWNHYEFNFDASRSNPAYGRNGATKVVMDNLALVPCIKAYGTIANEGVVDAEHVLSDIEEFKRTQTAEMASLRAETMQLNVNGVPTSPVHYLGSRTSNGTLTFTGLVIGRPVVVIAEFMASTSDSLTVKFQEGFGNTHNSHYTILGSNGNGNMLMGIPTATTASIEVADYHHSTSRIRAYQL